MDKISTERRSWNMSQIRSKDTRPEMIVRSYLHRKGFRFRLHVKTLPGQPDIVLPKYKTVVEVRGCFWHKHEGCKVSNNPLSNADYWQKKFQRNIERDKKNAKELYALGWRLIVVWECETSKEKFPPPDLAGFVALHSKSK